MTRYILGADPGGVTGLALLDVDTRHFELIQATPGATMGVAASIAEAADHYPDNNLLAVAIEKFVVGPRAGRSSTPGAGQTARDLVGALSELGRSLGARVAVRPAVLVKQWATADRLRAAGLVVPAGMGHSVDAARHALYEAVHSGLLPDPLSADFRRRRV